MFKSLFFLFFYCAPLVAFCQYIQKSVRLEFTSYNDTIKDGPSSIVKLRLTNTSDSTILISDRISIDMIAIRINEKGKDTTNTQKLLEHADIDYISSEVIEKLKPGETKDYEFHPYGFITQKGSYKIKFFSRINVLNKDYVVSETDWINQYCSIDYNEYMKQ